MFRSASGSAASDDAVVKAMSQGSFTCQQEAPDRHLEQERDRQQHDEGENGQRPVERQHEHTEAPEHADPAPAHGHRDRRPDAYRGERHHQARRT